MGSNVGVNSGVVELGLVFTPPGAAVSGLEQICNRVNVDKSFRDFVRHTDLAIHLCLLAGFQAGAGPPG